MNDFRMRNQEREINKTHVAFFKQRNKKKLPTMHNVPLRSKWYFVLSRIIDRIILNYLLQWKCDFLHQKDNKDC